jgi:hypothetical protein
VEGAQGRICGCILPDREVEEPLSSSGRREEKVLVIAIVLRGVGKIAPSGIRA